MGARKYEIFLRVLNIDRVEAREEKFHISKQPCIIAFIVLRKIFTVLISESIFLHNVNVMNNEHK